MHAALSSTPSETAEVDMEMWISSTQPTYSVSDTEILTARLAYYNMGALLSVAKRDCKPLMLRYTT